MTESIYTQIEKFSLLSQEEIDSLYLLDGVTEKSLFSQRKDLEKRRQELVSDKFLSSIFGHETNNISEEIKQIDEKISYLESIELDYNRKMLYATTGHNLHNRIFPSIETRNQVFLANMYLLEIYARRYQYANSRFSYDDIFQIASEALLSACYYYVPNSNATFSTYASKCIDNKIRRVLFKKKKKKKINPKEFLKLEKDKIRFIQMYLDGQDYQKETYSMDEEDMSIVLNRINKKILDFNQKVMAIGEKDRILNRVSTKKKREDIRTTFNELLELFSEYIMQGKLNVLITDEERRDIYFLEQYYNGRKYTEKNKEVWIMQRYIELYMSKIQNMEMYLRVYNQLLEENDGIIPSTHEILIQMNKEISSYNRRVKLLRKNELRVPYLLKPLSYIKEYYNQFHVSILEDLYSGMTKEEELFCIEDMYEDYYINVETDMEIPDIIQSYESMIEELQNTKNKTSKVIFQMGVFDTYEGEVTFDYIKRIGFDLEEVDEESDSIIYDVNGAIAFVKQELEKLNDLYLTKEEFIKQELKRRKDSVNEVLEKVNLPIYEENRSILEDIEICKRKKYKKKYRESDLEQIEHDIKELYINDDELMILMNSGRGNFSNHHMPLVEEQCCVDSFLDDYYAVLDTLPSIQKEILIRWFDVNGTHNMTAKEISEELGIAKDKVYYQKKKAMNTLRDNEVMKGYFNCK